MIYEPRFANSIKISSKPSNYCPGCGHSVILKSLSQVISNLKIGKGTIFSTDIGCSLLSWDYFDVDTIQTHHGRTTATSVGIKKAKPKSIVITYMGDGGGYGIGLQSLIHACHRNDPLTVIVVNNTVFSMTGGQMAPTTLPGEITDSSPDGKFTNDRPFLGPEMLSRIAHPGNYIARTAVSNPPQVYSFLERAVKNQIEGRGFSLVEILSYCPVNWKTDAQGALKYIEKMKVSFVLGELIK